MGNFGGDYRGGVGKSGVMGHKTGNISETRKDRRKVTMEAYTLGTHKRFFERYHHRPPTASPFPKLGIRNPNPKAIMQLLSRERLKLYGQLAANNRRLLGYIRSFRYHQPQHTAAETA